MRQKMLTQCKLSMLLYNNHNTLVYVTLMKRGKKIHTSSKWKKNEGGNNNKQQLHR